MNSKKRPAKALPVPPQVPPKKAETERSPINTRKPWYVALLIAGALLLGASAALALLGTFDVLEERVFNVINHASLPAWVTSQLAKPISNAVWGMVGLVVVLLIFPKFRLLAWQYAVAGGTAYAVTFVIEHLVNRARPIALESYEPIMRATQDGPGFPSGHVAVLTALALTLWPMVAWPWRIFMLLLICAEAWSRMFLGVHAPLDVVGGLAVGMTVVAVIHLLPGKIRKTFKLSA